MADSTQLTYAGVLIAVLLNQACLPVPAVFILMGAGALSAQGEMRLSIIIFMGLLGCLVGDGLWFWCGRRWGSAAMRLLCQFSDDPRECSKKAHESFQRYGLRVLCVSKFVPGLDGLIPPLSGAQGVSLPRFLAVDAIGSALWSGFYVYLGYLFSKQLAAPIQWAQRFSTAVFITGVIGVLLYAAWRGVALVRMIKRLEFRRISPGMLDRKLKSSKRVAVIDVERFEGLLDSDSEREEAIPGAFKLDPVRLRKSPHVMVPGDVEIILYSSSGDEAASARAAVGLNRVGIQNVWVLEGGLAEWRNQGLPVSQPALAEFVMARLGVKPRET
jgi:membrane protein DedA with SNARE-associated domain/rhodanese-related sulfurtransferase